MNRKIIRCAIYTRKSTEEGLEQEFNSLDAQREAGEAYIKSQKHEGWELIPDKYDDGGYSGGNMDRPSLKQLLKDIAAGKIDVVVVYKVDRLTRALSDFAKIIEVFDKQSVSFVSVTQQFNTTTSMGRLTLNVLLSFAQFEREVTGERIRDKVAASKKKGLWMGGNIPLGYDIVDKKLIINEPEADIVKYIYKRYLERTETISDLLDDLKSKGYKNKSWIGRKGKEIVGKEFDLKQIHRILSNPAYYGKTKHKDKIYDGEHQAIIPEENWKKAQEKTNSYAKGKNTDSKQERPKLYGKIWDYHGNRLTSSYSYKYGDAGRYKMKYYINQEICRRGKTQSEFRRIRSENIDNLAIDTAVEVINKLTDAISRSKDQELSEKLLKYLQQLKLEPENFISKVILYPEHLELTFIIKDEEESLSTESVSILEEILGNKTKVSSYKDGLLYIKYVTPTIYRKSGGKVCITRNGDVLESVVDKQAFYPEDKTFIFIAKSFYWSKLIKQGVHKHSGDISRADNYKPEYVKRSLRQRYLSPNIIEKIVNPKEQVQIGVDALIDFNHWCWEEQKKALLISI